MAQFKVKCARSVEKFRAKHADLAKGWPAIERELAQNPFPRGDDLIVHLKGPLFCRHRIRALGYRYLYEVAAENRAVWVYDVDVRGQVY